MNVRYRGVYILCDMYTLPRQHCSPATPVGTLKSSGTAVMAFSSTLLVVKILTGALDFPLPIMKHGGKRSLLTRAQALEVGLRAFVHTFGKPSSCASLAPLNDDK